MLTFFSDTDCDVTPKECAAYGIKLISMPYTVGDQVIYPYIDENAGEFAIYPNPVSNTLYVSGGNAEYSYELFNGMGQMVTKGNGQGMTEINVNGMAKGIYFLRLSSGTQVRVEKVVVE